MHDVTNGTDLQSCGYSNDCPAQVVEPIATTHVYRALIETAGGTVIAQSNTITVTWSTTIVLNASTNWLFEHESSTLTATSVSSHPIRIMDEQSGATIGPCTQITPGTCSVTVTNGTSLHTYVATQVIGTAPHSPVVSSNGETVLWERIP